MKVLDAEPSLLLWGAERPFQIQMLAGLARLGRDVLSLVGSPEGKALIDQMHPKNKLGFEIPANFQGNLIWAPVRELFTNSELSTESLAELEIIKRQPVATIYLFLPQKSFSQMKDSPAIQIYFPTLVGFGDQNIFDKTLDYTQRTGSPTELPGGELLSVFDAVSFALSVLREKTPPAKVWVQGQKISREDLTEGLREVREAGALGRVAGIFSKLSGRLPHFESTESAPPSGVVLANDFYPTLLTPWSRFFRDSYRIYKNTTDSSVLLHFRPTRSA